MLKIHLVISSDSKSQGFVRVVFQDMHDVRGSVPSIY